MGSLLDAVRSRHRGTTPIPTSRPFAFDNIQAAKRLTGGGPEAVALADKVSDAWIAFARTGSPDTPKLPTWTKYNSTARPTMVFNTQSAVVNDPIRDQRLAIFKVMA